MLVQHDSKVPFQKCGKYQQSKCKTVSRGIMAPPRKTNNTSKRGRAKQKQQNKADVAGSARQRQRPVIGVDEAYRNIEKRYSCDRTPAQDACALGATKSSSFGLEERSLCVLQIGCMRSKDK
jgi:hypothetical protein